MFQREWLSHPEFSHWVSGVPDDDLAYCKLCNTDFSVCNGISSLKSHGKGVKHKRLERESQRNKRFQITSLTHRLSPPRSSTASRTQNYGSPTAGINVAVINSLFTPDSQKIRQNVSSKSRNQTFTPSSSHNVFPSTSGEPTPTHRQRERSPISIPSTSRSQRSPSEDRSHHGSPFHDTISQMFEQHDLIIRNDCSDFLETYKESARYSVLASSSQFDRYSSIKKILDDYMSQHRNLRNKIKKKLTDALN